MTMKRLLAGLLVLAAAVAYAQIADYKVEGDGIPKSLTGTPGNAARGRELLLARDPANCLECHTIARDKALKGGSRGPALDGIGANLTAAQLRLSVVDYAQIQPKAGMPSFHKRDSGLLSAKQDRDKPVLSAQQIEDVVAFLQTLRIR
jgi:L-cysteine S-thiosulfotransferase